MVIHLRKQFSLRMVITGKADEVALWDVENILYLGMRGEYMHLHTLDKN